MNLFSCRRNVNPHCRWNGSRESGSCFGSHGATVPRVQPALTVSQGNSWFIRRCNKYFPHLCIIFCVGSMWTCNCDVFGGVSYDCSLVPTNKTGLAGTKVRFNEAAYINYEYTCNIPIIHWIKSVYYIFVDKLLLFLHCRAYVCCFHAYQYLTA